MSCNSNFANFTTWSFNNHQVNNDMKRLLLAWNTNWSVWELQYIEQWPSMTLFTWEVFNRFVALIFRKASRYGEKIHSFEAVVRIELQNGGEIPQKTLNDHNFWRPVLKRKEFGNGGMESCSPPRHLQDWDATETIYILVDNWYENLIKVTMSRNRN